MFFGRTSLFPIWFVATSIVYHALWVDSVRPAAWVENAVAKEVIPSGRVVHACLPREASMAARSHDADSAQWTLKLPRGLVSFAIGVFYNPSHALFSQRE